MHNTLKLVICLSFCLSILTPIVLANSTSSAEMGKLRGLAGIVELYLRDNKQLPRNLESMRDYVDLPRLLGSESDPLGPLTNRYTFLPIEPLLDNQGESQRRLLLLEVKPRSDGKRGAIWRYPNGDFSSGLIDETKLVTGLKNLDLANLKPMGGDIPPPTHPFTETPITGYQEKILQLAREGKINPQISTPDNSTPIPDRTTPQFTPRHSSKTAPTITPETKPQLQPSSRVPLVVGIFLVLAVAGFVINRRKP